MAIDTQQLLGREDELTRLRELFGDTLPWTAIIAGEPGIGKTALWLAARDEAAARDFRVLSARPSGADAGFSFSGLADLFGNVVPEVQDELPPPQRVALEAALGLATPDGPVDERLISYAALTVLRKLIQRGRLLVAVDDLQWLDAPSLAVLQYALPRLEGDAVAALLAVRGDVPAWLRRGQPLEMELRGLSVGAVFELLRRRLDRSFTRPTVIRIHERSGGNPFFALELGRALLRRGGRIAAGEELPLPPSLEALLQERLAQLPPAALEVARVVAALAEPIVEVVEAVARDADAGLAQALESGVLELDDEQLRFTHPLLSSAVTARTGPKQRRSLHARLAGAVAPGEERARHLALAASGPNADVAAVLDEAARSAYERGAITTAAELAERALALTPGSDADERARRCAFAADRLLHAGDIQRAAELVGEELTHAPAGRRRAALLLPFAEATWALEGPQASVELFERALGDAEGDAALEARAHHRLADVSRFGAGASLDHALRHAELAVAASARAGDAELRCDALAMLVLLRFLTGHGGPGPELDEALVLERSVGRLGTASWTLGHLLAWSAEELGRARGYLHAYRDALHDAGDLDEQHFLWWLTVVEWRAGNWDLAARHAQDNLALAEQSGQAATQVIPTFGLAAVAACRGDVEQARRISRAALARGGELGIGGPQALHWWVLGFVELSLGDPGGALEHLLRASNVWDELPFREPGHRLELADTVEALIGAGELEEAERRLAARDEVARRLDRPWAIASLARCRGLLLAARRDLEGALAAFDDALAQHARVRHPLDHGRTLLALGATQRRAKKRAAARATLEEALTIFEGLGARLWAERARAELSRIGGRTSSRNELTESERRIAALVAQGRSNREVASALFLTEHSVETALTRIYRKLGLRSRSELAHLLSREASNS